MRALTNRAATLTLRVEDDGGNLTNADTLPTVEVFDGAGDSFATPTVTSGTTGVYTATITTDTPDVYQAEWSYAVGGNARTTVTTADVVDSRLLSLHRLRDVIDTERTEHGFGTISDEVVIRAAEVIEDWFTSALGFPAYQRSTRLGLYPRGGRTLRVREVKDPLDFLAGTVESDPLTADDLAKIEARRGGFEWTDGTYWNPRHWLTAHVTHGLRRVPADLRRGAEALGRHLARKSDLPERATEVQTEGAFFSLALPGPNQPTGLPEVDAALRRYRSQAWL